MLPFTRAQFLAVFGRYNEAVWPAQLLAVALGVAMVLLLRWRSSAGDRWVGTGLALMWSWTGIVYHAMFFATINRAAFAFAALFVVQGLLLARAALQRGTLRFDRAVGPMAWFGWALVGYATLAYPVVGLLAGQRYPQMPVFGITPCPVTLLTFGLLLLARQPVPRHLLIVPAVWSLIGGSAAFLLAVPEDWPLLIGGLAAACWLWMRPSSPGADAPGDGSGPERQCAAGQRLAERR